MATAGPNAPGTLASDNSIGSVAWTNPGNAASSNNSYASTSLAGSTSEYLKATNFGFAIPTGATINGIQVDVEKNAGTPNRANDNAVRIVKNGSIGSTDKSNATDWPSSDTTTTYGGAADLWSETWTASDINASNFGCAISATVPTGSSTADIDAITITITYTEASNSVSPPALQQPGRQTAVVAATQLGGRLQ